MVGHNGKPCPCQRERENKRKGKSHQSKHSSKYRCRVCSWSHPLKMCKKFLAMSAKERQRTARLHDYCLNCLAHNHHVARCQSKARCTHCKKAHHTLLHFGTAAVASTPRPTSRTSQPSSKANLSRPPPRITVSAAPLVSHLRMSEAVLLPTICANVKLPDKSVMTVRCLLCTGTAFSSVYRPLLEKIGSERFEVDQEILTRLTLFSAHDDNMSIEHVFRVEDFERVTPNFSLPPTCAEFCRNITLADPTFFESSGVDIILGMDIYNQTIIPGRLSRPGQPDAMNTIFGYTITGTFAH